MTVEGLGASIRGLEALARTDRARLMKQIGAEQQQLTRDRLEERRGNRDGKYPPSKRAQRDGGTTLEDTGDMMRAFRPLTYDAESVTMGFTSTLEEKKARWNQYGTRGFVARRPFPITKNGGSKQIIAWGRTKSPTPARPLFGVSPRDARTLTEKINDFWLKAIKAAGLKHG